ncbi:MAG: isoleucine--tRNA ligase, partial [Clostridia bacterium]|nr:isoleucine--tRNA ligase [Clostridia bacterium]
LGRAARNAANVKNRQPLSDMYVKTERTVGDYYREIVEDELNVRKAYFVPDVSAISSYSFKPQLKTVGPKYGKLLGSIRASLSSLDGNQAMKELESTGALRFNFGGEEVILTKEDLLIDVMQKPGYYSVSDNGLTVALCTELTPELIEEGFVREIVSKVQTMRKEADFNVTDHIELAAKGSHIVLDVLGKYRDAIAKSVLADSVREGEIPGGVSKDWNLNGEDVTISILKK